jgi:hypothetical protein
MAAQGDQLPATHMTWPMLSQGLQTADDLMHLYDSISTWLLPRGAVSTLAAVEADQLGERGSGCTGPAALQALYSRL